MRLKERTLTEIMIAQRQESTDGLGGVAEAFSDERILLRASVLPEGGSLEAEENGLKSGKKLRLLAAADTPVQAGDMVFIGDRRYIVLAVENWCAHLEMICGEQP